MHRDRAVAEQGFRAGSGDNQIAAALGERITDVPEKAVFLGADHFQIGHGGMQHRIPVHQALAAIDQPFFIQPDEHLAHRRRQTLVHGEALARPVHRSAHAPQLPGDGAAGFRLPGPDPFDERLATEIVAALAHAGQLPLNHHLRGDAGMIGARLPQGIVALHPVVAGQRIHDGVLEGMAHVQGAGDIRRRDHDAIGRTLTAGRKTALLLPESVPAGFYGVRFVGLVHGGLWLMGFGGRGGAQGVAPASATGSRV